LSECQNNQGDIDYNEGNIDRLQEPSVPSRVRKPQDEEGDRDFADCQGWNYEGLRNPIEPQGFDTEFVTKIKYVSPNAVFHACEIQRGSDSREYLTETSVFCLSLN